LSKEKRWRVTEIVSTEKMVETKPKVEK